MRATRRGRAVELAPHQPRPRARCEPARAALERVRRAARLDQRPHRRRLPARDVGDPVALDDADARAAARQVELAELHRAS
ncbi:MAG: hypothetical protein A3I17_03580 [Candidatus Rokubacteria bacterium RIFCSPLOWO2_02_FULL_72_37]|nr:MAG: hypothetical protein A3I17_03580 [Candidatus Rokubacteria bacterium RIFCSPLOWO2_02_FULL_72_37]